MLRRHNHADHPEHGTVEIIGVDSDPTAEVLVVPVSDPDRAYSVPRESLTNLRRDA